MATLDTLKRALREKASSQAPWKTLSDAQYSAGFDCLMEASEQLTYQQFIIPQLSQVLSTIVDSRPQISVLEIGPGPESVIGSLSRQLRKRITRYSAHEPNVLFASRLEEWFHYGEGNGSPMPQLGSPPSIFRAPFELEDADRQLTAFSDGSEKGFDMVLFCHSMYGMKPKRAFIEQALKLLNQGQGQHSMVVVFHRGEGLHFDGLVCHRTASFPMGVVRVANHDETLDKFSRFIAGFTMESADADHAMQVEWRSVCRSLGRKEEPQGKELCFRAPSTMTVFNKYATRLPDLLIKIPSVSEERKIKNWEARHRVPAAVIRPKTVLHVQQCVLWALKHRVSLSVVGGSHSGNCVWPNVVAIDMSAFNQLHILNEANADDRHTWSGPVVVVETGCKAGDVVRQTMAKGLTVPVGSRPSVGAGSWLQGGIGHLTRQHGLSSDAIVGAVLIRVDSGEVVCVGRVPDKHQPANATRVEHERDLLWAVKGAGTNFGIVISITFNAYPAPSYQILNWTIPLNGEQEAERRLLELDNLATNEVPVSSSMDLYLYWESNQLHCGVAFYEPSVDSSIAPNTPTAERVRTVLGKEANSSVVNAVELFETEMYMSGMHGGHAGGKTSSFKRCVFLKSISAPDVINTLKTAIETRPTHLCYLHLLHGGGAVANVDARATAFGCRDWDFACVVTGVWPRQMDGEAVAQTAVQWVYGVVNKLLPFSSGVYGADLGPDPRDAALATRAFGSNGSRLTYLKQFLDPQDLLGFACPLSPKTPKLIILVTGEVCAGKDFSADVWAATLTARHLKTQVASISDVTKREYAAVTCANLRALLGDRAYKEQHRSALTSFYHSQVRQDPWLPNHHFLRTAWNAKDADVLFITGMRDEAPVASLSHLVPQSRLLEVRVYASEDTRRTRRGFEVKDDLHHTGSTEYGRNVSTEPEAVGYPPSLTFNNVVSGTYAAQRFAETRLLPLFYEDLQRLRSMVTLVPDFPRLGVEFRHVLNVSQAPDGLNLCAFLLQTHFVGEWSSIYVVVCCESGGFVFASALAVRLNKRLALIREAGKLPPPTISASMPSSNVSSLTSGSTGEKTMELNSSAVPEGSRLVIVDDVLASGRTLCAMLKLLEAAGLRIEEIHVMVVAEFPIHQGRDLLRQSGFGTVHVQSLLTFDGV